MNDEGRTDGHGGYDHPDADWSDGGGATRPVARRPGEVPDTEPEPLPGEEHEGEPPEGPDPRRERVSEPPDGPVPEAEPGPDGDPEDPPERGGPGEPLEASWGQAQPRYPAQERPQDRARGADARVLRQGTPR